MRIVTPFVPEEFAIEAETLDPWTKLELLTRTMYNPVPTLAAALGYLSEGGVEISDEMYDEIMQSITIFAASSHWGTVVAEASLRRNSDSFMNTEKVYAGHRTFITALVYSLRNEGHDIPVQSWEPKPEPSENKEGN